MGTNSKSLDEHYKVTGKRVELITGDGAFVLKEESNNSGGYIQIVDDDDQIEIVVEG